MFCPGMSLDALGRAVVTGGDDAAKTSSYNPPTNAWIADANMNVSFIKCSHRSKHFNMKQY
jgi:galactose oxidase